MAELRFCPKCNTSRECTKKGLSKSGEQYWFCKTCGKKFIASTATSEDARKTKTKESLTKKSTEIIVNNNSIKNVSGTLDLDQAFVLISSYFKEIVKDKAEIIDQGDKRIIKFKVVAGQKG